MKTKKKPKNAPNGRKSGDMNEEKQKAKNNDSVRKYLDTKNPGAKRHYRRGFDLYEEFSDSSLYALLMQVDGDRKKPLMARENPEFSQLNSFIDYLVKERKLAPKTIRVIFAGISDYFDFYGVHLHKRRLRLPKNLPKENNEKMNIRIPEVRKMLEHCVCNRDKAIVLCLFQSGMSISDLLAMNVGDVIDGDSQTGSLDDPPILFHKARVKNAIKYRTCFSRDGCNAVKRYLEERKRKYGPYAYIDPLFIKLRSKNQDKNKERLDVFSVDMVFKKIVVRSGLVSPERLKAADLNPARPHSLRMAFSSILRENGCPKEISDYLMGHKISNDSAYLNFTDGQLRDLYKKYEKFLTVEVAPILGEKEFGKKIEELESTTAMLKSQYEANEERLARAGGTQAAVVALLHYLVKNSNDPELEKIAANIEKNLGDRELSEARIDDLKKTGIKKIKLAD
ncbi:MAG: site-specific integrase [Methanomicrobia archaeon]|nr:site-specific integrase [Methanomicrobia archaeon]